VVYLTTCVERRQSYLKLLRIQFPDFIKCVTTDVFCALVWPLPFFFFCEAIGTAATPGLLCQPRVMIKMIVVKQMECTSRLAGETEVLGENLPQRYFRSP
jgi:hypothetical protein